MSFHASNLYIEIFRIHTLSRVILFIKVCAYCLIIKVPPDIVHFPVSGGTLPLPSYILLYKKVLLLSDFTEIVYKY